MEYEIAFPLASSIHSVNSFLFNSIYVKKEDTSVFSLLCRTQAAGYWKSMDTLEAPKSKKCCIPTFGKRRSLNTWYNYGIIKPYKGGDSMPQIVPISHLKNTSEISEMCHAAREPIFITKNGYGDMVLMSMENYERMVRMAIIYEELEESERQVEAGQTMNAREHLASVREKYGV